MSEFEMQVKGLILVHILTPGLTASRYAPKSKDNYFAVKSAVDDPR